MTVLAGCGEKHSAQRQQAQWVAPVQVDVDGVRLIFQPGRVIAETPVTLELRVAPNEHISEAFLTGINMYMGKIPLQLQPKQSQGQWKSQFMVGACTEPEMRWQLTVLVRNQAGTIRRVQHEFQSYLN